MTKADLIEEVSRVVEMTRKESEVIVEAIFDSIVRSLRGGDKIEIRGFGSFRTRQRQSRVGPESEDRHPRRSAREENSLLQTQQRVEGRGECRRQGRRFRNRVLRKSLTSDRLRAFIWTTSGVRGVIRI